MLGGIAGDTRGGLGIGGGFGDRLRRRTWLQIHSHRTAAGPEGAMGIAGDNFYFQRRQLGAGRGCGHGSTWSRRSGRLSLNVLVFRLGHGSSRSGCRAWLRSNFGGWRTLGWLVRFRLGRIRKPEVALMPEHDA